MHTHTHTHTHRHTHTYNTVHTHKYMHRYTQMNTRTHNLLTKLPLSLATPSIATQPNTTCSALSAISAMGQGCSVTPSCNEVDCVLLGYSTGFLVLPCNTPPAVGIMVNDTRNTTLFYQVISQTQQISLFGLTTLDVTVVQLSNALGLKVR